MTRLREDLEKGAASVFEKLHYALPDAELVLQAMRSLVGLRDVENLYVYDDIHAALVHLEALRSTVNALVKSAETVR